MAYVRGGIRRGLWEKYPPKLKFINKHRRKIKNPNPKGKKPLVWGGTCFRCGEEFPQNNLQVDHVSGNHSLNDLEDIGPFIEAMLLVTEEDMALVCKGCHKIKNHAERFDISFDEATMIKQIIQICKEKRDKEFLKEAGHTPAKNAKLRRKQIENILLNKENLDDHDVSPEPLE